MAEQLLQQRGSLLFASRLNRDQVYSSLPKARFIKTSNRNQLIDKCKVFDEFAPDLGLGNVKQTYPTIYKIESSRW